VDNYHKEARQAIADWFAIIKKRNPIKMAQLKVRAGSMIMSAPEHRGLGQTDSAYKNR
jgi:hypothetical protein